MSLNPDDPTVPLGLDADSKPAISDERSDQSEFVRALREAVGKIASNKTKEKLLVKEIDSIKEDLKRQRELGPTNYDDIDQLALAADNLEQARKAIDSASGRITLYAPDALKEVFATSPLVIVSGGCKITIKGSYIELFKEYKIEVVVE